MKKVARLIEAALPAVIAAATGVTVAGCSSSGTSAPKVDYSQASLRRVTTCADLTASLRDDASSKMNRRIDAEIEAIREGYVAVAYEDGANGGAIGVGAPAPGGATSSPTAPATPAHSDTETQVKGVDEADIVKADGTRMYVLHGQKLLIVDAWPAANLATAGSADIEGQPLEMFVANGKAVIFSTVDGNSIYAAAGVTPRPEYSDGYGYYGGSGGLVAPGAAAGAMAPTTGPVYDNGSGYGYAHPLTKVTVLALDGATAHTARELYFEGRYLSSRRVGSHVRIVLEGGAHGPSLQYSNSKVYDTSVSSDAQIGQWNELRSENESAIAATTYADWVPTGFTRDNGQVQATPTSCGDVYVPTTGTTQFGMTQIQSIDLDAPTAPPATAAICGAVDTVYGNENSMILAGAAYVDPWLERTAYMSGSDAYRSPTTLNYTHLHLFNFGSDATTPVYVGSGPVPGAVGDQFALDEKNGTVRVTTNEMRSGPVTSNGAQSQVSHVFVLQNHAGRLSVVGDAGEIGAGESLYATRYVGDKAYVVTFRVTDPLFVVDLANPTHPTVLGALSIPGFSEYMHPLDDTHLLTIGRETDDTGHQHTTGGQWYGIAIQLFDVTDPLKPKLQQKYVYDGGEYATSDAMNNHKAFTYFDDRQLLAFPYVRMSAPTTSTLEVFHVDVTGGITKLGSVDHSSLLGTLPDGYYGYCGGYFDGYVRRGVFFENVVYSISYGGIMANDVSNLTTPLATLKLASPTVTGVTGVSCGM